MSEIVIPPSSSWNLSNIVACNGKGNFIAFGSRQEIIVLKTGNDKDEGELCFSCIPLAHKEKVTAVAFAPSEATTFSSYLASAGEDGVVKIWDYLTLSLIYYHSGHSDGHKPLSISWSKADSSLIVSISDLGSIVCWDLVSNTIRRLFAGNKIFPLTVACCPHNKEVIAIGAKAGLVVVYNIKGYGEILFRLRGHESDVISLAFCPVPYNVLDKKKRGNVHLLATGSKDRGIYLWKTATEGRYELSLTLPTSPLTELKGKTKWSSGSASNWTTVCWPEKNTLLCSSLFGELVYYNLLEMGHESFDRKKYKPKLLNKIHNRGLYSIVTPDPSLLEGGLNNLTVWTSAMDKNFVCTNFKTASIVHKLSTIGGVVYALAASPLDPNRIAIGCSDNKISIWNLSSSQSDGMTSYWNKINSKVMALAWHPRQENLLAFGTGEGRVGLLDLSGHSTVVLRLHHHKSVYALHWSAPVVPTDKPDSRNKDDLALFSLGDGEILQYDSNCPDKVPLSLSPLLKQCDAASSVTKKLIRSDISWNHNQSLAGVGNENGCLYIVDGKTMKHMHSVFLHKTLIQCIVWHPGTVTSEDMPSAYSSWVATASENIQVINVTSSGTTTIGSFKEHAERIVSLAWSPHVNGRLVSASYDYTAQVWDVIKGTMLSSFEGHNSFALCCLFSPINPDHIITGGSDFTVRLWDWTKHSAKGPSKTKKERLHAFKKKLESAREATDLHPVNGTEYRPKDDEGDKVVAETKIEAQARRRAKSMFPVSSASMMQAKHVELLSSRLSGKEVQTDSADDLEGPSIQETCYLDFFSDGHAMRRLLLVEENHHMFNGNMNQAMYASVWSGGICDFIKEAIKKKQLNEMIVSMAPLVSYNTWVECCTAYATQLAEVGDGLKAANYLLAIHKVEEAVDVLIETKRPREAVALAKCQFLPEDPTVLKAVQALSKHCISQGQLLLAAHCALSIGEEMEAVELLGRSKEANNLSLAARLAAKHQNQPLVTSLVRRAVLICIEKNDYEAALEIVSAHPNLKDISYYVKVCSEVQSWDLLDEDDGFAWLSGTYEGRNLFQVCLDLLEEDLTPENLNEIVPSKPDCVSIQSALQYICGQIMYAVVLHKNNPTSDECVRHIVKALEAAYSQHIIYSAINSTLLHLCAWFCPKGPLEDINLGIEMSEAMKQSIASFIIAGALYWLEFLQMQKYSKLNSEISFELISSIVKKICKLILEEKTITFFKNDILIKKLESSVTIAKVNLSKEKISGGNIKSSESKRIIENGGDTNNSHDEEENDVSETQNQMKLLEEVKLEKTDFENKRCSSPNPFVIYCALKNVLQGFIPEGIENHPVISGLVEEVTSLWNNLCHDKTAD